MDIKVYEKKNGVTTLTIPVGSRIANVKTRIDAHASRNRAEVEAIEIAKTSWYAVWGEIPWDDVITMTVVHTSVNVTVEFRSDPW